MTPFRQLDTRYGTGTAAAGAIGSWATVRVKVTGRGGIPETGVSAVSVNVTVIAPGTAGHITVYAGGTPQPGTSNLNFAQGQTIPNLVTTPVGADGTIALTNNSGSTVHLIADTAGYYVAGNPTSPGTFTSLTPFRQLDTREGTGASAAAAVGPWGTIRVKVTGRGGIPASGVSAVVANVTVTRPGTAGHITVYAGGTPQPGTSNLNFAPGETIPNLVTTPVGADGTIALTNNSGSTVHLIADTAGYYLAGTPTAAGAFNALSPYRQLDTREGIGATAPGGVAPWSTIRVKVTGRGGIPENGATTVVVNVTVTRPGTEGNITAFAGGTPQPGTSNLNFTAGETIPNMVHVAVGADGTIALANNSGSTIHLIADTAGYYLGGTPAVAGVFNALTPYRQLDTREGIGATAPGGVGPGSTIRVKVTGRGGVPEKGATTVVMDVTVTGPGTEGNIAVYAGGTPQPGTSNLNFTARETIPNLVQVNVGADGTIAFTTYSRDAVHIIADTVGYYLDDHQVLPGMLTSVSASLGVRPVELNWSIASGSNYAGVVIRRAQGSNPPATPTDGTAITDAPAPLTTFSDQTIQPLTTYTYAFFPYDAAHNYSTPATVATAIGRAFDNGGTTNKALLNTLAQRPPEGPAFPGTEAFGPPMIGPDGCTTQQRFLLASGNPSSAFMATTCTALSGYWFAMWENRSIYEDPSQLTVAYTVPLEEAWYAGAWAWTPAERRAYANETQTERAMEVMSIKAMAERGSADPASWWPSYRCNYAQEWVWMKARWNLTVDPHEYDALTAEFNTTGSDTCGNPGATAPPLALYPGVGPAAILGNGWGWPTARIQAYDANQSLIKEAPFQPNGTFELTGLPPGEYRLRWVGGPSGTSDLWSSEQGPGGPPTVISSPAGNVATGLRIQTATPPALTDDAAGDPMHDVIASLFATGINDEYTGIKHGFQDASFVPTVKREALAAFFYQLAGAPPVPDDAPSFSDVPPDHRFYNEIRWLASTGITKGYPHEGFHPDENVHPEAMAALLYVCMEKQTSFNPAIAATAYSTP